MDGVSRSNIGDTLIGTNNFSLLTWYAYTSLYTLCNLSFFVVTCCCISFGILSFGVFFDVMINTMIVSNISRAVLSMNVSSIASDNTVHGITAIVWLLTGWLISFQPLVGIRYDWCYPLDAIISSCPESPANGWAVFLAHSKMSQLRYNATNRLFFCKV